ncbi:hypothetical protein PF005_g10752 [Phytophthora fragariae]|uniref:Uncharacterized protein n=1 Tax=Phytophthora fragariae TaxID=53985 RepID=A0A6A3XD73_9STRA|nr:hypothetical protein PF003_g24546 [Phytophthora fragariae]KAE8927556.1 hypothetical protein PF009_g22276 [Phytophthora fragariae]KAE8988966.1 hypothetical protein PF011_g18971 [Phytophthora fragariae]KAE9084617.1 hypothetical protein PF007_g21457 [Phytophthora fragariae]KAE9098187.1 hypothetical protein PF010_g15663 [Phytophthora fragariae]
MSDIEIFRKHQAFYSQNTKKSEVEKRVQDAGLLLAQYPDEWALLTDKGY